MVIKSFDRRQFFATVIVIGFSICSIVLFDELEVNRRIINLLLDHGREDYDSVYNVIEVLRFIVIEVTVILLRIMV